MDTAEMMVHQITSTQCHGATAPPVLGQEPDEPPDMEYLLRNAIENERFEMHYQPIVDVESEKVVALEALLRWGGSIGARVPADLCIGLAERTGLIIPLGERVLEHVLRDIGRWQTYGCSPVQVAVNVSAAQLRYSDFPARLIEASRRAGLSPSVLQVELTESMAFERPEGCDGQLIEDPLMKLRDMGVHIAIDDFGTRYSSLSYLKRWPVDSVKIDRLFVRDLATDPTDLAIVAGIGDMARRLAIPMVAEGVETHEQLEKLRELGCPLVQGYLFGRPAPADECRRHLTGKPIAASASAGDSPVERLPRGMGKGGAALRRRVIGRPSASGGRRGAAMPTRILATRVGAKRPRRARR